MSSIFNPLNFVSEQLDTSNVLSNRSDSYEKSYMLEALAYVRELNSEYAAAGRVFYKSILESNSNQEVVTESFSGFFNKIKDIIVKFLKFMNSLFERFINSLNRMVSNDKYIIKNKEKFKLFNSENDFSFTGYTYTFSPSIPTTNPLYKFTEDFLKLRLTEEDLKSKNQQDVSEAIKNRYKELIREIEEYWFDDFRKDTLGEEDRISQSDFANALFCKFRDDTSDKESIDVTSVYVTRCLAEFEDYKETLKGVKANQREIESEYTKLIKQIDDVVHRNKDKNPVGIVATLNLPAGAISGYTVSSGVLDALDLFIKAKTTQVQEMSAVHAIAFTAKLDAISEQYKQNKAVLYKSLYTIQGSKK